MRRRWGLILLAGIMSASLDTGQSAAAQDADQPEDVKAPARPAARRTIRLTDGQFDRLVFGSDGDADSARMISQARLASRITCLDQVCGLSQPQRRKLELAGRGDIKRLFDRIEGTRAQFLRIELDNDFIRRAVEEMQALERAYRTLFEDDSLFAKTSWTTLDPVQSVTYRGHWDERGWICLQSRIEWVCRSLQKSLPLNDRERLWLFTTLLKGTRLPREFGPMDYYGILLQFSQKPEARVRPVFFDESHWQALQAELDEARKWEPMLRRAGGLPDDRPPRDSVREDPPEGREDAARPASGTDRSRNSVSRQQIARENRAS
jgi:hypothetical protein